jgi:hypothetical protein
MKQEDKERRILINRLKTVRDPRERDQIIQLLARTEKYGPGKIEESAEDKRTVSAQARGPAEAKEAKAPKGAGFMLGYAVPGFFVIFGLVYIVNALTRMISDEGDQSAISQIIMGALFLFFGIISFLRMRKMRRRTALYRGGGPEARRPNMFTRE